MRIIKSFVTKRSTLVIKNGAKRLLRNFLGEERAMLTWNDYQSFLGSQWVKSPDVTAVPRLDQWQHDSRNIAPKDWFLSVRGARFDGQDFIKDALRNGAAGFICDETKFKSLDADSKAKALVVKDVNI